MDMIEAMARAILRSAGMSPDTLYQHHEWEDWPVDAREEYVDAYTGERRVIVTHLAWRHRAAAAQAALEAAEPFIQARIDEAVKAMQEAAARVASEAHLIQPDGRSSSEDECEVARNAAACIRAINYLRDNIDKLEAMEARDAE